MLSLRKSPVFMLMAWLTLPIGFLTLFVSPVQAEEKPQIYVQMGHPDSVASVSFSPDGRYALSGSNGTIKLWDIRTGREIRTFRHSGEVNSVSFSPDGRYGLSGSNDRNLRLWDLSTGREVRTFQGNAYIMKSVSFSPDGRYALSVSNDGTLKLWDVSTGKEVRTFQVGHPYEMLPAAFSPDGRYALSGSEDKTLKLWDISTGMKVKTFEGHSAKVTSVAFGPDGRYALSGSEDKTLKLWDISTGREVRTFQGHTNHITKVSFSPDGRYALSGSHQIIKLWDISTGREVRTFQGHGSWISSLSFSQDNRHALSSGAHDNAIKLWDLSTGRQVRTFSGSAGEVSSVSFSPDGRHALFGSRHRTITLWDISTGRQVKAFRGTSYEGGVEAWRFVYSPEGRRALPESSDLTAKFFDEAYSPDGRYVLNFREKTLALKDISGRFREVRTFQGHTTDVNCAAFSPDGRYALSASQDKTVKLWDVSAGEEVRTFQVENPYEVLSVSFSPDGRYVLTRGNDKTATLWDVSIGEKVRTFQGHSAEVASIAFGPDGRHALTGSDDKTLKLWDISTGREVRTFQGHSHRVNSVALSPDARYAISGSSDGEVKIWNASTGSEICTFVSFQNGEWIAITPDGYFDASPNGARYLNVRVGNNVYGIDQFYAKFYRPELVQLALAGKELPKAETLETILAKSLAPLIQIISPTSGSVIDKETVIVALKITDRGGGIGNINIYLNGSQVANESRAVVIKGAEPVYERKLSFSLPLIEGLNEIKAVAFNRENAMESNPATVTVASNVVLKKPNLYALVIGINEYKNKSISLTYAVSDAKAFAASLRKTAAPLFEKVDIRLLTTPAATTKEAIMQAFEELRTKTKPNDLFVFFDASHGIVDVVDDEEQYFLITSNVLLLSSRHIGKDAMSQKELARLVGSIPAQKKLVILDTCNAGKGGKGIQVALLQQTRGLSESTAVKLLQRAIGSAVFSASSDTQQAFEGYKGHGLFTYVLMEGLQGKADVKKDGYITVLGLADYVEGEVARLSEEVFKRQQTPTIQTGTNFPIGKIR